MSTFCPAGEEVLRASELARRFEDSDEAVFDKVNLTLCRGEFASILGLSGVGKTTLFHVLAGLDQPTAGQVWAAGKIGYMLQKDLLLPWKRLIDNVALPLLLAGKSKKEARRLAASELPRFGLSGLENRYPAQLSGGERQRVALLRTLLYGGEILLLDEPFAGIDAITRQELSAWLKALVRERGLTVLLITHDIAEALSLSDRLYVLRAGRPATLSPPLTVVSGQETALRDQAMNWLFSRP